MPSTTSRSARGASCSGADAGHGRAPGRGRLGRRDGRDVRVHRRGARGLAPLPALAAHADRRGHRERRARSSSSEGEREKRFPDSGGRGAPTASVPLRAGDRTLGALGFRFERGHVFDDEERAFAVTLGEQCAYALERARVYDAERRGRGALGLLAAIGEQLARSLEPDAALRTLADLVVPSLADQCVVDIVEGDERAPARGRQRRSRGARGGARAGAVPARSRERDAGGGRDPHRPAAGRAVDRGAPGHRLPQPGAPRSRSQRGRHPHHALRADGRARPDARRAHVRLAEQHAAGCATRRSWPRRSPGASASRSTTARSTRRRTASASGSPRWCASCRSA